MRIRKIILLSTGLWLVVACGGPELPPCPPGCTTPSNAQFTNICVIVGPNIYEQVGYPVGHPVTGYDVYDCEP